MNLSLSRKRLQVYSVVGEETIQVMAEGTLVVPRQSPSVERILSLDILPKINEVQQFIDSIEVNGSMDVSLLYVSKTEDGEESVHSLDVKDAFSFERELELPGVDEKVEIRTSVSLTELDFDLASPTELDVDATIRVSVRANKFQEFRAVVDVTTKNEEALEIVKDTLQITKTMQIEPGIVEVEKVLDVPSDQPLIERMIKLYIDIKVNGAQVLGSKLVVRGIAIAQVLYGADSESGFDSIQYFERDLGEFTCEMELPVGSSDEGIYGIPRIRTYLGKKHVEVLGDGERVRIAAEIKTEGEIDKLVKAQVLAGLKSEEGEGVEVETTPINIENYVNSGSTRVTVERAFEVEDYADSVERVLRCAAVPFLTNYRVLDDLVLFEGNVMLTLICLGDYDGSPYIYSMSGLTPFEGSINISGAEEGMSVLTEIKADRPSFHIIGGDRVELAVGITLNASISSRDEVYIVTDAVVVQPVRKEPGLTIYMVQSGDTLWRISRKYGVDSDTLLEVNGLGGPDDIKQGRKLIIPRY